MVPHCSHQSCSNAAICRTEKQWSLGSLGCWRASLVTRSRVEMETEEQWQERRDSRSPLGPQCLPAPACPLHCPQTRREQVGSWGAQRLSDTCGVMRAEVCSRVLGWQLGPWLISSCLSSVCLSVAFFCGGEGWGPVGPILSSNDPRTKPGLEFLLFLPLSPRFMIIGTHHHPWTIWASSSGLVALKT